MNFGAILQACRIQAGLSQEELAARLFINQSDVSKIETGRREPTMSIFQAWVRETQSTDEFIQFQFGLDMGNSQYQIGG